MNLRQPKQADDLDDLQDKESQPADTLPAPCSDTTQAKQNAGGRSAQNGCSVGRPILGKELHGSFKAVGDHDRISFAKDTLA